MTRIIQNNFSAGEISPVLYGRSDLQAYYKGCADAENFVVTKEGTLRKRHGITSFASLGNSYSGKRVIPYKFDRTDGGFVVLSASGSTITASYWRKGDASARSTVSAKFSGSVSDIQAKQIGDQLWLSNGEWYRILTITDNTTISESAWHQRGKPNGATGLSVSGSKTYTSGRTIEYAAYVVSNGVMSNRRSSSITWAKTWEAGTYIDVTVSWDTNVDNDYVVLCKKQGGSYGEVARWYPEDANGSATFHDENISAGEAVYAQTNVLGPGFDHPLCVDCFQQRKVFANATNSKVKTLTVSNKSEVAVPADFGYVVRAYGSSSGEDVEYTVEEGFVRFQSAGNYRVEYAVSGSSTNYPMTMWFSEVGNLDNFYAGRPSTDADAFSPTISTTGPAFIRWICCFQEMIILFTDGGLFSVGFSQTQGFSASTCRISRFSQISASPRIQPVVTDAGVVFVGADEKTVYTASFDLQENAVKPINRSVLVEHLTRNSRITSIGLQEYPNSVVWCSTKDGRMLTFTFEKNEEVYAWAHSRIDGANVVDLVSIGTVTDSDSDRTFGDMVFVVEKDGEFFLARFNDGYEDVIGGESTDVVASMTTLRAESQDRTVSGISKNVKDVLFRLYQTTGISVKARNGNLVPVGRVFGEPFSGDVKIMPRGFQDDNGQITVVSHTDGPCEILEIVSNVEVSQ